MANAGQERIEAEDVLTAAEDLDKRFLHHKEADGRMLVVVERSEEFGERVSLQIQRQLGLVEPQRAVC